MEDIKEYVYRQRGNSFYDYDTRYSFDQTIQAKVQSHTRGGYGFREGKEIFQSLTQVGIINLATISYMLTRQLKKLTT